MADRPALAATQPCVYAHRQADDAMGQADAARDTPAGFSGAQLLGGYDRGGEVYTGLIPVQRGGAAVQEKASHTQSYTKCTQSFTEKIIKY